ncbi:glycosyltransferase [Salinibacter ruber]|uniref:Glycosyl transferase, family 2 n=1 Tax=Salinibacter ruber (strain M8) TaxID=761659 RepID=D5H573_SALRM|nr:glycosyltransferase [Salinibacter ruber]CBH23178.1 Glycosyl transferase, family 2 [Salinibacter ruber M8]
MTSVIIPCYNDEEYVRKAIHSALAQTYPNIEVIIIDDGSTDDSPEIIQSFGGQVRWEQQANQGAPTARNRGLELAEGKYVKFLDADDVLVENCIKRQVQQSERLPKDKKAVVFGDAIWVDEEGNELDGYDDLRGRKRDEDPVTHLLHSNPLTSCPLHRREYLQEVGGFDPSLPRSQEHDLHLRLALAGVEFVYEPGPTYYFRQHEGADRISGRSYAEQGLMTHYELVEHHAQLIEKHRGSLSSEIRQALGQLLWRHGRAILREGHEDVAQAYFDEAMRLADGRSCVVGSKPYRLLYQVGGPVVAERAMSVVKRVLP